MSMTTTEMTPGKRVRVKQRIDEREGAWTTWVEGVVERVEERATGSWFAGGKRDKLWLQRLLLKKDDGELVLLNLDDGTQVESLL